MADADLRALERAARETGDPADEARWLAAGERAGVLERRAIELAAFLGHAGACAITGETNRRRLPGSEEWFIGLADFGCEALLRAGVALARAGLGAWLAEHPDDERPGRAIDAAEAWARAPSFEAALAAGTAAAAAEEARDAAQDAAGLGLMRHFEFDGDDDGDDDGGAHERDARPRTTAYTIAALASAAARVASDSIERDTRRDEDIDGERGPLGLMRCAELSEASVTAFDGATDGDDEVVAEPVLGPTAARAAHDALLAWALGRDPLGVPD